MLNASDVNRFFAARKLPYLQAVCRSFMVRSDRREEVGVSEGVGVRDANKNISSLDLKIYLEYI